MDFITLPGSSLPSCDPTNLTSNVCGSPVPPSVPPLFSSRPPSASQLQFSSLHSDAPSSRSYAASSLTPSSTVPTIASTSAPGSVSDVVSWVAIDTLSTFFTRHFSWFQVGGKKRSGHFLYFLNLACRILQRDSFSSRDLFNVAASGLSKRDRFKFHTSGWLQASFCRLPRSLFYFSFFQNDLPGLREILVIPTVPS